MKYNWSMRAYREGDEKGLFALWKAVYPEKEHDRKKWMRWWRWMYKDNPAGAGWIMLAENDNKIVGHSAVIPVKMKVDNEIVTSFQSVDAMTHPDYRGQGIYLAVEKGAYTAASEQGALVGYTFANDLSYPIAVKKLDWLDVARRQPLIKVLNWKNIIEERLGNRFLSRITAPIMSIIAGKVLLRTKRPPSVPGLEINQISSFDERIDEFWNGISRQCPIMVVKNKNYLNWRYVTIPDVDYVIYAAQMEGKIYGYLVFRREKREHTEICVIFDIMAQSEEIAQHLISKVLEYCEQEKLDALYCSMIANKLYPKVLKRNGFISWPFLGNSYFMTYSSSPDIPKEFLQNPQNWIIQEGDSDRL